MQEGGGKVLFAFGPASITLDTNSAVKINYGVPIKSATKLKKHKVGNGLIQTFSEKKDLDSQ